MLQRTFILLLCAVGAMSGGCGPAEGSEWATNEKPIVSSKSGGHDAGKAGSAGKPGDAGAKPVWDAGDSHELCGNGLDDDGNGKVDEGCPCGKPTQPCYPGKPSQAGVGSCTQGVQNCLKNGEFTIWGPCQGAVLPAPTDPCNGLDDDCDGVIDNGCVCTPGTTVGCGSDVGACQAGIQTCTANGSWGECAGSIGPVEEVCNGIDDDCDGQVDEIAGCECVPGAQEACGLQVGECKPGLRVCQAGGTWSECVGATPPGQEVCNGKDDDCDGVIDPGCQCLMGATTPCGSNVGACKPGNFVCQSNGTWSGCQGEIGPQPEICGNGIDEDCNGVVDDGCQTTVTVNLDIDGDCVTASCPPGAPYPIGCNLVFAGGDSRGCVASTPSNSTVYFQEGNNCGAGHVSGTLVCSNQQGAPLNEASCQINKSKKFYPGDASGCPAT